MYEAITRANPWADPYPHEGRWNVGGVTVLFVTNNMWLGRIDPTDPHGDIRYALAMQDDTPYEPEKEDLTGYIVSYDGHWFHFWDLDSARHFFDLDAAPHQ